MKMNSLVPLSLALLSLGTLPVLAQLAVPEPAPANADLPIRLDNAAPLDSLENQLASASFDQRGALATAFDAAVLAVDERVAEFRSQGLELADEALANLATARDDARQAFRDLSLTTEETWQTARHNGVLALRKIRGSIQVLRQTASVPR
jgi:hypothetical protein